MRCGKCGNENSDANRFCGMCGAPLVAHAQPSSAAAPPAGLHGKAPPVADRTPEPRLPARPVNRPTEPNSSPSITGPSFLGLNKPGDGPTADGRSSDPLGRPSRNLDYLLEDFDEEPKRGWGTLLLVVIALLLAVGFGYLHWKQGGFDFVTKDRKPASAADSSQGPSDSAGSATPSSSAPASGVPASNPSDASATPQAATPVAANPGPGASEPLAAPPAGSNPASESQPGPQATTAAQAAPSDSAPPTSPADTSSVRKPVAKSAENAAAVPADSESTTATPKSDASISKAPARKPSPVTPVDATAEAERYIYGQGVKQDCDRGLRILKSAAQSNAKAMIATGVLYSTGTCMPRDLPTAYRWFAMALHKEPDNQALQDDLQQLWAQMTQPERQLAIKLSQ